MMTFFAAMLPVGSGISIGEHFAHVSLCMMVFRVLMSTIIGSASIFIGNQAFILDGHVRLTDYLLKALAKAFFDMCMYLPAVAVALWLAGGVESLGLLTTLPALVLIYINRSEEHTSELQSLMRISYAVFCLKKKTKNIK